MKYFNLIQIKDDLKRFKKLKHIKRVDDNLFKMEFDKEILFFDLNKKNSSIYMCDEFKEIKNYKAPFDILLQKRLTNSNILELDVLKNNRILFLKTSQNNSYKRIITYIYFEFTGRFTNVVITDENSIILEALRHNINDKRSIQVGFKLIRLDPIDIKEKDVKKIIDFKKFYEDEFKKIQDLRLNEIKLNKINQLDKKISNLNSILEGIKDIKELEQNAKELSKRANLLFANLYKLKDYERDFNLITEEGEQIHFKLDKSPKISTNLMFKEAKKLKQKAKNSHIQISNLNKKISFLKNLKNMILNSNDLNTINVLMPKTKESKKIKENENIQNFYIKDYKISIGKNEIGNSLLLKESSKNDFWFHLKNRSSAHVIVKTNKKDLSDDIIQFAANLCVNFSVKNAGNYEVDYTKRLNVKVVQKAFVNYVNFKTINIFFKGFR